MRRTTKIIQGEGGLFLQLVVRPLGSDVILTKASELSSVDEWMQLHKPLIRAGLVNAYVNIIDQGKFSVKAKLVGAHTGDFIADNMSYFEDELDVIMNRLHDQGIPDADVLHTQYAMQLNQLVNSAIQAHLVMQHADERLTTAIIPLP